MHCKEFAGRHQQGTGLNGDPLGGFARGYGMFVRMERAAALAALTGCAAALALSGCHVDSGQLQHQARTYAVSSPVHMLVINGWVGDVHVTAGTGRVSVTERISYRHQLPATTHAVRAGTLTLTGSCPVHQPCDVEYHVQVPPATTVRIDDRVGNIRLTALTGQVMAHTNAGGISLRSLSGTVQMSDHAGSISGSDMSSATAMLSTNVGSIDVSFSAAPATVAATTSVGSISLQLPRGVVYAVHASATVGSIHVTVPQASNSAHSITARTQTGSVTIRST
jgi:Putative adhesin